MTKSGWYNNHRLPGNPSGYQLSNESGILMDQHEGLVRLIQSQKGVDSQTLPPNALELVYLGFKLINESPKDYSRFLDILMEYKNAKVIDDNALKCITYMLETNLEESEKSNSAEAQIGVGSRL